MDVARGNTVEWLRALATQIHFKLPGSHLTGASFGLGFTCHFIFCRNVMQDS